MTDEAIVAGHLIFWSCIMSKKSAHIFKWKAMHKSILSTSEVKQHSKTRMVRMVGIVEFYISMQGLAANQF